MPNGDRPPEPQWLFYILSFIIPIAGIVIGAIYMGKGDAECREFGRNCIIAAVAAVVVCCLCYCLYLLVTALLVATGNTFY